MNPNAATITSVEREISQEIMKTDIFIKILQVGGERSRMLHALDEAFDSFRRFEARFSRFRPTSELTVFNQGTGGLVSSQLFALLSTCATYYHATDGIFDPTVLPTLEDLGYPGASTGERTSASSLGFDQVILDPATQSAKKPRDVKLDLGGIGKGYAVDMVTQELYTFGYTNFLVDAGGDIYAAGTNEEAGYPFWAIDVENPAQPRQSLATVLLRDEAIATSGRNRRTWLHEGQMVHHLIDPRRAKSVETSLLTVSTIAPTTTEADVRAKTLFILGPEQGFALAQAQNWPALFVTTTQHLLATDSWGAKIWHAPAAVPSFAL